MHFLLITNIFSVNLTAPHIQRLSDGKHFLENKKVLKTNFTNFILHILVTRVHKDWKYFPEYIAFNICLTYSFQFIRRPNLIWQPMCNSWLESLVRIQLTKTYTVQFVLFMNHNEGTVSRIKILVIISVNLLVNDRI